MKKEFFKKALKVVSNKYFITAFLFVIWSMFFDQNDWLTLRQKQKELDGLKSNIAYLNKEISIMQAERDGLLTDRHKMEQYARENYRMKHENEDVYVIDADSK